jgi:RimJ/RimL family protein N-acetyltransferase
MKIIETDRLEIRELSTTDATFIIELLNSPGWLRYIGDRNVQTTEDACNYIINGPQASYAKNNFGLWLVQLKGSQTPIGICGLIKRDTLPMPDLGFAFLPQFEGMGYALEAANAVMEYAIHKLIMPKVAAITTPDNDRSIKLLHTLGFDNKGLITFPGETEELVLWEKQNTL